jgi:diguanylate cyclase (GGDEF)-like protein/PAS domain S-box-containing protein
MVAMRAVDQTGSTDPPAAAVSPQVAEERRLYELRQLGLLDSPADLSFDRITRLAARALDVPIALVSLVDETRVWLKSKMGLEATEVPRNVSFCAKAVELRGPYVIANTLVDPCTAAHPLVTQAPHARAYIGVPLLTRNGQAIGTLCAMDTRPRDFSEADIAVWKDFASLVEELIHARELAVESEVLLRVAAASEQKHTEMERRLQRIADHIPALIGYWNPELRCEFANDAYRAYSGLTPEQMIGRTFKEVLGEELFNRNSPHAYAALRGEPQRFQRRMPGPDGKPRYTEGQYLPDRDQNGTVRGFFVLVTDVTELTAAKGALEVSNAKLLKESTTDFLTGLANRRVFTERSEELFRRLRETGETFGLILLDLDDFKQINDRLGHEIGDAVLREVGAVLAGQLRGRQDVAARLGGEEFAVLCPGDISADALLEIAGRIREQLNRTTVDSPHGPVCFTASFGVACSRGEDTGWADSFSRADGALYEAKEAGKDRIVFGSSSSKGSTGRFRSLGFPPAK